MWAREDSNLRHGVYKTPVLAAELLAHALPIIPLFLLAQMSIAKLLAKHNPVYSSVYCPDS